MDNTRLLRLRLADRDTAVSRIGGPNPDARPWLGEVVNGGAIGTGVDRYYLVAPLEVTGNECEGCTYTLVSSPTEAVPVAILRGTVGVGDRVLVRAAGGRWVAERKGPPAGATVTCGSCSGIPTTLIVDRPVSSFVAGVPVVTHYYSTMVYLGTTQGPPGCSSFLPAGWLGPYTSRPLVDPVASNPYIFLQCTGFAFSIRNLYGAGNTPQPPCSNPPSAPATYSLGGRNTCSPFYLIDSVPIAAGVITP